MDTTDDVTYLKSLGATTPPDTVREVVACWRRGNGSIYSAYKRGNHLVAKQTARNLHQLWESGKLARFEPDEESGPPPKPRWQLTEESFPNSIETYIQQHGSPPPTPSWLLRLLPGVQEGDPLSKDSPLTTPTLGFIGQLGPSQQRKLRDYVEWRGLDWEDFQDRMRAVTPAPAQGEVPKAAGVSKGKLGQEPLRRFPSQRRYFQDQFQQALARIHRRTPMDGVRTAEGGG